MPLTELVALMAEVAARIRFRLLASPPSVSAESEAIAHFSEWLGSYLAQQGLSPEVFTKQMTAIMRGRFSADEANQQ